MKTRTKNGLIIDFAALQARAGETIAVGNARMNARGDILTHGGIVEQTAEQAADAYYKNNPYAVTQNVALGSLEDEILSPLEAMQKLGEAGQLGIKPRRKTTDE